MFAFELKIRSTFHSYEKDIVKLSETQNPKKVNKYFIALIDTWCDNKNIDPRILYLNKRENLKLIDIKAFPTKQNRYNKDVCCSFGIWTVNS